MCKQSQQEKSDGQLLAEWAGDVSERQGLAPLAPPARREERAVPDVARIRRRAFLMAAGIFLLLLVAGLGDGLGRFLPHTTPVFRGASQRAGDFLVALQVTPNPPHASSDPAAQVTIQLQKRNGQPVDGVRVQLDLSMLTMDMGQNQYLAQGLGQGRYQATVAFLMVGEWQVAVTVTPPGGKPATTTFTLAVAR